MTELLMMEKTGSFQEEFLMLQVKKKLCIQREDEFLFFAQVQWNYALVIDTHAEPGRTLCLYVLMCLCN